MNNFICTLFFSSSLLHTLSDLLVVIVKDLKGNGALCVADSLKDLLTCERGRRITVEGPRIREGAS
jgi:hypothetical protein